MAQLFLIVGLSLRVAHAFVIEGAQAVHLFDGNARLARVVLDAVLWREGFMLYTVEPIFVLSRRADDCNGAWLLACVVITLMGRRDPL